MSRTARAATARGLKEAVSGAGMSGAVDISGTKIENGT